MDNGSVGVPGTPGTPGVLLTEKEPIKNKANPSLIKGLIFGVAKSTFSYLETLIQPIDSENQKNPKVKDLTGDVLNTLTGTTSNPIFEGTSEPHIPVSGSVLLASNPVLPVSESTVPVSESTPLVSEPAENLLNQTVGNVAALARKTVSFASATSEKIVSTFTSGKNLILNTASTVQSTSIEFVLDHFLNYYDQESWSKQQLNFADISYRKLKTEANETVDVENFKSQIFLFSQKIFSLIKEHLKKSSSFNRLSEENREQILKQVDFCLQGYVSKGFIALLLKSKIFSEKDKNFQKFYEKNNDIANVLTYLIFCLSNEINLIDWKLNADKDQKLRTDIQNNEEFFLSTTLDGIDYTNGEYNPKNDFTGVAQKFIEEDQNQTKHFLNYRKLAEDLRLNNHGTPYTPEKSISSTMENSEPAKIEDLSSVNLRVKEFKKHLHISVRRLMQVIFPQENGIIRNKISDLLSEELFKLIEEKEIILILAQIQNIKVESASSRSALITSEFIETTRNILVPYITKPLFQKISPNDIWKTIHKNIVEKFSENPLLAVLPKNCQAPAFLLNKMQVANLSVENRVKNLTESYISQAVPLIIVKAFNAFQAQDEGFDVQFITKLFKEISGKLKGHNESKIHAVRDTSDLKKNYERLSAKLLKFLKLETPQSLGMFGVPESLQSIVFEQLKSTLLPQAFEKLITLLSNQHTQDSIVKNILEEINLFMKNSQAVKSPSNVSSPANFTATHPQNLQQIKTREDLDIAFSDLLVEFTKTLQFPVGFWLPLNMLNKTPISTGISSKLVNSVFQSFHIDIQEEMQSKLLVKIFKESIEIGLKSVKEKKALHEDHASIKEKITTLSRQRIISIPSFLIRLTWEKINLSLERSLEKHPYLHKIKYLLIDVIGKILFHLINGLWKALMVIFDSLFANDLFNFFDKRNEMILDSLHAFLNPANMANTLEFILDEFNHEEAAAVLGE